MNVQKIIKELNKRYPGKKIVKNPVNKPTKIVCEIEPTVKHSNYSIAISVIDKSMPHYHKKTTEIYEVIRGQLSVTKERKKYKLKAGDKLEIKPGEIHSAIGKETWFQVYSEPGWTAQDHILMSLNVPSALDGIYNFLTAAYRNNWQYRWAGTPYLKAAIKSKKRESVAGHVWSCMLFWFLLRRICPILNCLVDSTQIYEILLNHDLGETYAGDIPLYCKIQGATEDKESERKALKQISNSLPETQKEILVWFDEFEKEISEITKLEVLIAKLVDNLQGNHFALVFGQNLATYSKPINEILQIRFVVYINRLIEVLEGKGEDEAAAEVKQIAKHHADLIKATAIKFDTSKLKV